MTRSTRYLALVAAVLIALGLSFDDFGIDLQETARTEDSAARADVPGADSASRAELRALAAGDDYPDWSSTAPNINLRHVFAGEINRQGKPVGYHARPGGVDPEGARVLSVRDGPNRAGVYTATVAIRAGEQHDAAAKEDWRRKFSTFFPDSLSHAEVVAAILAAYHNRTDPATRPFQGPSGHGFAIQGYTSSRGGIVTAFPVYAPNP